MSESNIFTAIIAVMSQIGYVKKQRSPNLNYSFAGEAALIAALRPDMVEQGIFMTVSKISNVVQREYTTAKGTAMVNVSLVLTLKFYHAPSGTFIEVEAAGEGSDTGDKATAKAMTAAYKYALRETFCIETGDDPDKDPSGERQVPQPVQRQAQHAPAQVEAKPDDAEPAPANWAGVIEYSKLAEQAKKLGLAAPVIEPMKNTKGQVRGLYARLTNDVAKAQAARASAA